LLKRGGFGLAEERLACPGLVSVNSGGGCYEIGQPGVSSKVSDTKRRGQRLLAGSRSWRREDGPIARFPLEVTVCGRVAAKRTMGFELGVVGKGSAESALELGAKER
jgi:hypothetical protein